MNEKKSKQLSIRGALADCLKELLGPASNEIGQTLADQVRLYRWKSALNVLKRAEEIAKNKNIKPKDIPYGFLVPFIEKSSLVDEQSELTDFWSNLFVSALDDYNDELASFVHILSEMTPRGSKILNYLMSIEKTDETLIQHPESINARELELIFRQLFDTNDIEDSLETIVNAYQITGFAPLSVMACVQENYWDASAVFEGEIVTNEGYNSLYLLERQRLIKFIETGWKEAEDYELSASGVNVTSLGFSFYCRCSGRSETNWYPSHIGNN